MARELSAVLDHVASIGELDLDGVAPTSHVVDVTGALRPTAAPMPAAGGRPRAGARRSAAAAFSSRARRHERADMLGLSAAAGGRRDRGGLAVRGASCSTPIASARGRPRGRRGGPELLHLGRPRRRSGREPADAPLGGVPLAVKDLFCTEGVPSQSGSRILEGYLPPYTASVVRRLDDAGASLLAKTNQDEFAMGSSNENSAFGAVRNPWDRARVPGGSSGGSAAAVAAGLAPWALGTDTGGSIRQPAALCGIVGLETHLRLGLALRDDRLRLLARPGRAAHARRARRGAAAAPHGRAGPVRRDLAAVPARDRAAHRRAPRRRAPRRARGAQRRGHRSGRARRLRGRARARRGARRRGRARSPAARAARAVRLLRARARRGLLEPRALRRRALRDARRPDATRPARHVHAHPPRRLRPRGQAPHHARHLRALRRLLRRLLRPRAARAHEDRRGLPHGLRGGRPDRHADRARASPSGSARRPTTRWRCTSTTTAPCRCRSRASPRSRSPAGSRAAGAAGRLQIAGPAFSENRLLDAAHALERAIGFDGSPARV